MFFCFFLASVLILLNLIYSLIFTIIFYAAKTIKEFHSRLKYLNNKMMAAIKIKSTMGKY